MKKIISLIKADFLNSKFLFLMYFFMFGLGFGFLYGLIVRFTQFPESGYILWLRTAVIQASLSFAIPSNSISPGKKVPGF